MVRILELHTVSCGLKFQKSMLVMGREFDVSSILDSNKVFLLTREPNP